MAQVRWSVERGTYTNIYRERNWMWFFGTVSGGADLADPLVVRRMFKKTDLTGARFEISCQVIPESTAFVGAGYFCAASARLLDGDINNQSDWANLAYITDLGQISTGASATGAYEELDFTTATMTTGDITGTEATIAFMFRCQNVTGTQQMTELGKIRAVRVMQSDGVEKYFATVIGLPIVDGVSANNPPTSIFNNEEMSVYFSTRWVEMSEFYELTSDKVAEFRIVNARAAEISVTAMSCLTSEQSDAGSWASVKTATPISVNAGQSTTVSVQVDASSKGSGDFFFVLKLTYNA